MVTIKLARFGKKKQPSYRIIVTEKHKDPFGNYIEAIGHINYYGGQKNIVVNKERAEYWLSVGAQPTATVNNLFVSEGISKNKKQKPDGVRKKKSDEPEEGEASGSEAPASDAAPEAAKAETPEEKPAEAPAEPKAEEAKEEKPTEEEKKDA